MSRSSIMLAALSTHLSQGTNVDNQTAKFPTYIVLQRTFFFILLLPDKSFFSRMVDKSCRGEETTSSDKQTSNYVNELQQAAAKGQIIIIRRRRGCMSSRWNARKMPKKWKGNKTLFWYCNYGSKIEQSCTNIVALYVYSVCVCLRPVFTTWYSQLLFVRLPRSILH